MKTNSLFWVDKRILLTGHTGFKGGWLALWLQHLGAEVTGISLPSITSPNLFELTRLKDGMRSHYCDIREPNALKKLVYQADPEIVFHLAAQPLVRASYREPIDNYATNVMGTVNILDALRNLDNARVVIMITTDKIYRNREWPWPYREDDALGGHDPYSASKAASEIIIDSYRKAFLTEKNIAVASARAGNVIGGGDWSEDRLIPDAVRAWNAKQILEVRRPHAIRPWQHVLEPLFGYIILAEKLWDKPELTGAYNFGPESGQAATVQEVIELARSAYGHGEIDYGDGTQGPHEAGWLGLEIAKARTLLGIIPKWDLNETVNRTMTWYRSLHEGADAETLCKQEIAAYEGNA
jgi:CDP-glucose 4,6-dehydratase